MKIQMLAGGKVRLTLTPAEAARAGVAKTTRKPKVINTPAFVGKAARAADPKAGFLCTLGCGRRLGTPAAAANHLTKTDALGTKGHFEA